MNALEVNNLSKSFGGFKAVDDVSFTIPEGVIFGLLGRNGAGKSTTIRMLMNIYEPDSGQISFRGNRVGQDFRDRVGYLPEERGLNTKLRVLDTLLYLAELKGKSGQAVKEKAQYYLDRFELGNRGLSKIQELSKGNQQKIQFISTVLHEPDFIILDEPFSGMDPVNVNLFKDIILEMRQQGRAIIFSTHLMHFAETMCDHIALIDKGRLLLSGKLSEVKARFSERNVMLHYEGNIDFLRSTSYVRKVQDFGNSSGIEVGSREDSQRLLQDLLTNGVRVRKFDANDISLNDIFLSQTGGAVETQVQVQGEAA
jgi:ABC-2 type transport system ATP-binding protein